MCVFCKHTLNKRKQTLLYTKTHVTGFATGHKSKQHHDNGEVGPVSHNCVCNVQ